MKIKSFTLLITVGVILCALLCSCHSNKPKSTLKTVNMEKYDALLRVGKTAGDANDVSDAWEDWDEWDNANEPSDGKENNNKSAAGSRKNDTKDKIPYDAELVGQSSNKGDGGGKQENKPIEPEKNDNDDENPKNEDGGSGILKIGDVVIDKQDRRKAESRIRDDEGEMVEEKYSKYLPAINEYVMDVINTDYGVTVVFSVIDEEAFAGYIEVLRAKGFRTDEKVDGLEYTASTGKGIYVKLTVLESETRLSVYESEKHFD
ncbi:MAG: hypothetical protein IJO93_04610 [Clostridia bacterium]|nr:hypothetical protein [Clostridia bacterium]